MTLILPAWSSFSSALFVTRLINFKKSCSFKWPKKERHHSCAAQNTENIHRKYPKCITWFKNISDISDYWDFHYVPEEKWISHISASSPTIVAKGPPRPGRARPSQLDHKGTLFFTPKPKAFSCCAVSVVAEEVTSYFSSRWPMAVRNHSREEGKSDQRTQ